MGISIAMTAFVVVLILLAYFSTKKSESLAEGDGVTITKDPPVYSCKGGVNNPGYLIHTNEKWQGKTNSDGCKFENFSTLTYGVRAWYVNLFGKVKKGQITNTGQMIDVLTPAGSENPEASRNNYKSSVAKAKSWLELGTAVFDFEANPNWVDATSSQKSAALNDGFSKAVEYRYGTGNIPEYFKS